MKVVNLIDFKGGYATNLTAEEMPANTLLQAENVYWENALRKRQGKSQISLSGVTPVYIRGIIRVYWNSKWTTVIAVDDNSSVKFYQDNSTSWTFVEINSPASYTFTTGHKVYMAQMLNKIVAVNGTDKPAIIYWDSGAQIKNLETYDTRTRANSDWYAGQYDDSATDKYIDDTTDAQSSTANDYLIAAGGTNNDGFYVAGVLTFNKVVLTNCTQFDGTPVASYQYYKGSSTWGTLTLTTTPDWTAAQGDKTLEFDYPSDWEEWDGDDAVDGSGSTVPDSMYNRFVIRIRFTTAPTSNQTCDSLTLYHTQYLTQIMSGDIPERVAVHNNRIFMSAGNNFNYSPYEAVTGRRSYDTDTSLEGGT